MFKLKTAEKNRDLVLPIMNVNFLQLHRLSCNFINKCIKRAFFAEFVHLKSIFF